MTSTGDDNLDIPSASGILDSVAIVSSQHPYRPPGPVLHRRPIVKLRPRPLLLAVPVCGLVLALYYGLFGIVEELWIAQGGAFPRSGSDIAMSVGRGFLGGMCWGLVIGLCSMPALLLANRRNNLHGVSTFWIVSGVGSAIGGLLLLVQFPVSQSEVFLVWAFFLGCAVMAVAAAFWVVVLQKLTEARLDATESSASV